MKKNDITSLIVYALILVGLFCTCYLGVIQKASSFGMQNSGFLPVGVCLVAIACSFVVSAIFIELGHVLGAKVGKYDIISFNLLSLTWYKVAGKRKFRFSSPDGLFGETIVSPRFNEKGESISKPKAMLWFSNLFLAALIIVAAAVYLSFQETRSAVPAAALVCAVSFGGILFYNFVPFELDNKTDGYQLKIVSKPKNIEAFNELLRVRACEIENKDPGDIKIFDEITTYTASINNVAIYKYLGEEKYSEALALINKVLEHEKDLPGKMQLEFQTQKLFILLVTNQIEKAKKFYEDTLSLEDRRYISNSNSLLFIRTYILVSCYLDPAESEVQYATSKADKAYKKVEALKKDTEAALYKKAVNIVKEVHPKWEPIIRDEKK